MGGVLPAREGYLGTELLSAADRHLVIDRWSSREAHEAFLAEHREQYERRSAETAALYVREEKVGEFDAVPAPSPAAFAPPAPLPAAASPGAALDLRLLPDVFAVCRLPPDAAVPERFWSVTRTDDELSVICRDDEVPSGATAQRGRRGLQVAGPLDFALTGVAAALTAPLAAAGVSVLPVATYDTDYLFVRESDLARAVGALRAAGHTVGTES